MKKNIDSLISETALSFPASYMTEQWRGAHVFKTGTRETFKMFAILRPGENRLTVKAPTPETRRLLIEVGVAEIHSHMKRGEWMVLLLDKVDTEDALERMRVSYDIIFPTLPKRVRAPLLAESGKG